MEGILKSNLYTLRATFHIDLHAEQDVANMATKTVLVDDMDGGNADVTIAFALNGEGYSMDLSHKNAEAFYEALKPWLAIATQNKNLRETATRNHLAEVEQRTAIRKWAIKKGMDISPRGRIPQEITDEYYRTHRGADKK